MNGNEPAKHPDLFDHEVRITRLEDAVKFLQQTIERGFAEMHHEFDVLRAEQKALRESVERQMEALRLEFHRDRRFSAMVFLTTQIAVVGALLRLAQVL